MSSLDYCGEKSLNFVKISYESLSAFIRVHRRPIRSFLFKSLANIKSVFICVLIRIFWLRLCREVIFAVQVFLSRAAKKPSIRFDSGITPSG
jgi:hypothetical protein